MNVTLLGTGDAMGVPPVFCDLETAAADAQRRRPGLLVETEDTTILCDCSPDSKAQLRRTDTRTIDAVFVTHLHHDHAGGIDELAGVAPIVGFDICLTKAAIARLERERPYLVSQFDPTELQSQTPISVGDLTVTPLPVTHGRPEFGSVAFAIDAGEQTVVYAPDVEAFVRPGLVSSPVELCLVGGDRLFRPTEYEQPLADLIAPFDPARVVLLHVNEWFLGQSTEQLQRTAVNAGYELGEDFQTITV